MTNISFWLITLHNKEHFVPGWSKTFGSTYIVSNPPRMRSEPEPLNHVVAYELSRTVIKYLPKMSSGLCTFEENLEMTQCVYDYILSKLGCTLPGGKTYDKRPECDMDAQQDKYIALVTDLLEMDDIILMETTLCVSSCHLASFSTRDGIHQLLF
jgi:hypothetical protein